LLVTRRAPPQTVLPALSPSGAHTNEASANLSVNAPKAARAAVCPADAALLTYTSSRANQRVKF
jgi:hypothetical protein